jgi:hypothetical protein
VASIENFVTVEMPAFSMGLAHVDANTSSAMYRGSRALLKTLEAQQRIRFLDITTGDESWIYLGKS